MTLPARRIRACSRPPRGCSPNYWRKRTITWTVHYTHKKTIVPKPLGTEAAVLVLRHRARVLALLRRQRLKYPVLTSRQKSKRSVLAPRQLSPSRDPLEYVASGDYHKQLVLSVTTYSNGGWKFEFKTSSLTIDNPAARSSTKRRKNGKSHAISVQVHRFRVRWFEHRQKLSLDLTFNPRNTAISSRPGEERYMCKTVFTQCHLQEDWCTEQKDVWIDWVKAFSYRPPRCLIIVHPYFSSQRRTELLTKSVHLSRAKLYVNVPCSSSDPFKDKRPALNKKQENGTSNSETLMTGTNRAPRNFFFDRHHFARSNNYAHDDFRHQNEQEGSWIFV